jgi:hypothetical protein
MGEVVNKSAALYLSIQNSGAMEPFAQVTIVNVSELVMVLEFCAEIHTDTWFRFSQSGFKVFVYSADMTYMTRMTFAVQTEKDKGGLKHYSYARDHSTDLMLGLTKPLLSIFKHLKNAPELVLAFSDSALRVTDRASDVAYEIHTSHFEASMIQYGDWGPQKAGAQLSNVLCNMLLHNIDAVISTTKLPLKRPPVALTIAEKGVLVRAGVQDPMQTFTGKISIQTVPSGEEQDTMSIHFNAALLDPLKKLLPLTASVPHLTLTFHKLTNDKGETLACGKWHVRVGVLTQVEYVMVELNTVE